MDLVHAANFSERDIKKLYKRFSALDTNQNGELDPHELFDVPEIADVGSSSFTDILCFFSLSVVRSSSMSGVSLVSREY